MSTLARWLIEPTRITCQNRTVQMGTSHFDSVISLHRNRRGYWYILWPIHVLQRGTSIRGFTFWSIKYRSSFIGYESIDPEGLGLPSESVGVNLVERVIRVRRGELEVELEEQIGDDQEGHRFPEIFADAAPISHLREKKQTCTTFQTEPKECQFIYQQLQRKRDVPERAWSGKGSRRRSS